VIETKGVGEEGGGEQAGEGTVALDVDGGPAPNQTDRLGTATHCCSRGSKRAQKWRLEGRQR
jgi:hypothetical protein